MDSVKEYYLKKRVEKFRLEAEILAKRKKKKKRKENRLISIANKLSKKLIKNATPYENVLRRRLIVRKIRHKFQYPIVINPNYYCLDFYFEKEKIAVEIDGSQHYTDGGMLRDARRTQRLSTVGIRVIRFTNKEIMNDVDSVIDKILKYI